MVIPGTEIDFEIEKEVWNIYELDDGTTLKMRTILTKLVRVPVVGPPPLGTPSGAKGVGFDASFHNVLMIHRAKPSLMGKPNIRPGPLEEAETIEVEFTTFSDDWNIYRVKGEGIPKGMKLRAKLVASSIVKTIGFSDQFGYPMYRVNSTNAIVPVFPKPKKQRRK